MDRQEILDAVKSGIEPLNSALETFITETNEEVSSNKKLGAENKQTLDTIQNTLEEQEARVLEMEQNSAGGGGGEEPVLSLGQSIVGADAFNEFHKGPNAKARFDVQLNTIIGESGSPQEPDSVIVTPDRLSGIVPGAFRALNLLDALPMGRTSANQVEYSRELAFTNNAAEAAEAATKAESVLTFEQVNEPVRTIAHFIKASKQVLDDAPLLASYIDLRLRHGVRNRLQTQIAAGNGTAPNLAGLSDTTRSAAYTPATGDNAFDTLSKAKVAVIGAEYEPDFIVLNPIDWGVMERTKISSSDDRYLAAAQDAMSSIANGMIPTIWGLPVITSNAVTSGKFHMLSRASLMLALRQDAVVEMFEQDGDNVTENLVTIRAEMRAALISYAPAANRYGSLTL